MEGALHTRTAWRVPGTGQRACGKQGCLRSACAGKRAGAPQPSARPRKAGDSPLVLRSFVGASSTGILLLDSTPDAVDPNHRASRRWADERTVRYDAYA